MQRVPATERQGRVHTSTVSVMVLPSLTAAGAAGPGEASAEDPSSDYYVDAKDVRTDVMRARGAGGQHVNTTESAVRLTHVPTGLVAAVQDERSQHKNREKAWQVLRGKLAVRRREERELEMMKMRRGVVGVNRVGREDKVRTYNWGQQRVTDHRSGVSVMRLEELMEGGLALEEIMESVRLWLSEQDLAMMDDGQ